MYELNNYNRYFLHRTFMFGHHTLRVNIGILHLYVHRFLIGYLGVKDFGIKYMYHANICEYYKKEFTCHSYLVLSKYKVIFIKVSERKKMIRGVLWKKSLNKA